MEIERNGNNLDAIAFDIMYNIWKSRIPIKCSGTLENKGELEFVLIDLSFRLEKMWKSGEGRIYIGFVIINYV